MLSSPPPFYTEKNDLSNSHFAVFLKIPLLETIFTTTKKGIFSLLEPPFLASFRVHPKIALKVPSTPFYEKKVIQGGAGLSMKANVILYFIR